MHERSRLVVLCCLALFDVSQLFNQVMYIKMAGLGCTG